MKPGGSPTVRMAVEAVRGHIRSGIYRPGGYLAPETELAATLGVSRGTVRRAIELLVDSGELKKRPYSRPTVEARGAPPVKGSEVLVWISHPIADGASLQFLRGISFGLMGTTYRMVVREPRKFYGEFVKTEEREFLADLLNNENAAGAIIERDSFAENGDLYARLIERGIHLVFVDIPAPTGLDADYVGTANVTSARRCTAHLLEMGHSRILFVTDTDTPQTIQDRMKGYWRAMRQAGLEDRGGVMVADSLSSSDSHSTMHVGGSFARILSKSTKYSEWAKRAAREILAMDPMPTGLFVACDVLAYWVGAYLEGAGIRVPGDIAIVGFDWLGRWDDPANDLLTSASQDFEGFGTHAAELLLDRVADADSSGPKHVLLPAPLVVRGSTVTDLELANNGAVPPARSRFYR